MQRTTAMKHLGWIAALLLSATACEKAKSKLDNMPKTAPTAAAPGANAPAPAPIAADHSGTVEERLTRIENYLASNSEAVAFLGQVYGQQKAQIEEQENREPAPDAIFNVDIAQNLALGQTEGPATAPVTIVDVWDFACPHCDRAAGVLSELVKEYDGKVRLVFKHMVIHPQQVSDAHLASCAAAKQGKFYAFYKAFWEKGFKPYAASQGREQGSLGKDNVLKIAGELGLDMAKLDADMKNECPKIIADDEAELRKFKVSGTPAFFINGQFVGGGLPREAFKQIIDQKLEEVAKSGIPAAEYYEKVVAKGEKQFRSKKQPKPAQ